MKQNYNLACPFLDESPRYSLGVEFGLLWAEMRAKEEHGEAIQGYFRVRNQEQITLAANRLGWKVVEMKPWESGWFFLKMERNP